jgi:hypothetical protein
MISLQKISEYSCCLWYIATKTTKNESKKNSWSLRQFKSMVDDTIFLIQNNRLRKSEF